MIKYSGLFGVEEETVYEVCCGNCLGFVALVPGREVYRMVRTGRIVLCSECLERTCEGCLLTYAGRNELYMYFGLRLCAYCREELSGRLSEQVAYVTECDNNGDLCEKGDFSKDACLIGHITKTDDLFLDNNSAYGDNIVSTKALRSGSLSTKLSSALALLRDVEELKPLLENFIHWGLYPEELYGSMLVKGWQWNGFVWQKFEGAREDGNA